jgi:hypothetical protein
MLRATRQALSLASSSNGLRLKTQNTQITPNTPNTQNTQNTQIKTNNYATKSLSKH